MSSDDASAPQHETSAEYWTRHNVTLHRKFETIAESLNYIEWRNLQHPYYIENMPVAGMDGKAVLDYGCGPGHDLVGFAHFSKPKRLIGMDVSPTSLSESAHRMQLHGLNAEFVKIEEKQSRLPLEDASIDVIHSSGVLHHTPDPVAIMREMRRVVRPDGHAQIMVYNYDSVWTHLYVAYERMLVQKMFEGKTLREAFTASTDGPECPISECYKPEEFIAMCAQAGWRAHLRGVSSSAWEMMLWAKRWDALFERNLNSESRQFLYELTLDERGIPLYRGVVAGINGCYELRPA